MNGIKLPEIIFNGEKIIEKYDKKVYLVIVNHEEFGCTEFIIPGVAHVNKVVRMYLNTALLVAKLDVQKINSIIASKQERAYRNNIFFNLTFETKRIIYDMIVIMLVDRVRILNSDFCDDFDVYFEPSVQDTPVVQFDSKKQISAHLDFEYIRKPINLKPFCLALALYDHKRSVIC